MSDFYRFKMECDRCHASMIVTVKLGSLIIGFDCSCGHHTQVRQVPESPSVLGLKVLVDPKMPPNKIEFRNDRDEVVGTLSV